VNLNGKNAAIYLSSEGAKLLSLIKSGSFSVWDVGSGQHGVVIADVEESEDLGVWLRFEREGASRFFLLRWEFVVGIEFNNDDKGRVLGLRG
jgi:hypothetical protein